METHKRIFLKRESKCDAYQDILKMKDSLRGIHKRRLIKRDSQRHINTGRFTKGDI